MKWIGGSVLAAIVGVALYIFFLWSSYLDVIVTTGEAYGFRIGETKVEAYERAREVFKDRRAYIHSPIGGELIGPLREFSFTTDRFSEISGDDLWKIFFDKNARSGLSLIFYDGNLVEIHRHRKYFEVP